MKNIILTVSAAFCVLSGVSCIDLKHEIKADVAPIEVKPIHITADININIKVDKALDDFFGDIDSTK